MAQVLIRDLDDAVVSRLKLRAKKRGRSLEAELRKTLEQSVQPDPVRSDAALRAIRSLFADRQFDDSTLLIRADRER